MKFYTIFILLTGMFIQSCDAQQQTTMLTEHLSTNTNAPVVVLFGGNPLRRHEVILSLQTIGDITIYGTLSEEEGIAKINALPKVDLVLIGGRYTEEQRKRIRAYVKNYLPNTNITEPGIDYPYETDIIKSHVAQLLFKP
jgi:hypothetical protein